MNNGGESMKLNKRFIAFIMAIVMVVNFSILGAIQVFAHDAMLDVDYDDCIYEIGADGINETWYILDKGSVCRHISHEVDTIKYYFADSVVGSTYTWTTDVSASVAQEIKNAYAESMKKWNNVYFYSYDDNGILNKHKIINIVEGTATDHNLTIYPVTGKDFIAATGPIGTMDEIESGTVSHRHYSKWEMEVNIDYFYVHGTYTQTYIDLVRERNGAHEFGHVLGLRDVDSSNLCNATTSVQHHHELLMGYGSPMADRSSDITYKDIAGVAITRGLHTDSDHKWLNCGLQSNRKYKLLCSICNGIIEVSSLSGYTYETYGACGGNHNLSDGNMIAVASYGTKDYYKCEYCRYVAPFDSNVTQNYTKTNYNSYFHKYVNNVNGLNYTFYEEHDPYVYIDKYYHRRSCSCGIGVQTERHTISASDVTGGGNFAPCMGCGYLLDLRDDYYNSIASITQVSINGSYVLPSGIVVLVDEDIQAYLDGTLVFYHPDNIPTTQ